jgi:hypothetical protein
MANAPTTEQVEVTVPRLRDRNEKALTAVFCLLFRLTRGEGLVLAKLMTKDYCSKAELQTPDGNSFSVQLSKLRQKLKPHGIEVVTMPRIGVGLDRDARFRIRTLLAQYDTGFIARPRGRSRYKPINIKPDAPLLD